jgi:adenylate cyclase
MTLSEREMMVAQQCANGETYKEIARNLHIAPSTVRNHLAAIYRKLGVKNKVELVRELSSSVSGAFSLPPPLVPARTEPILNNLDDAGPPPHSGASIAVMPFATIGTDEDAYWGLGIAANVRHDLTRCHDLLVTGQSSSMIAQLRGDDVKSVAQKLGVQYLLQGTFRKEQKMIRLIAELVDGVTGHVLWSERYDRAFGEILVVEAEIARTIATSLSLQIDNSHYERHQYLEVDKLSAYDWRLRGNHFLELGGASNLKRAQKCFSSALSLEPGSAAAYAGLSICYGYECHYLLTGNFTQSLESHFELAEQAIAIDASDSRGHYAMSCAFMLDRQYERASFHSQRGLELNPSEYHNICNMGYNLMTLGRFEESISLFTDSLRRNPLAPNSCLLAVGLIEYLGENYGQAAAALSRMSSNQVHRACTQAAACAQVGYHEAANIAVREFKDLSKEIPICPSGSNGSNWPEFWRRVYPYLKDDTLDHILNGLSKAGLPT